MTSTFLVSPSELDRSPGAPDVVVADCRFSLADPGYGRREYLREHVPGAVYVHLDEDLSGPVVRGRTGRHPLPALEDFARSMSRLGVGPDVRVIAYDDCNGSMAARLWWLLMWTGHENVAVLDRGWHRWKTEGRPTESGQVIRDPRPFAPRPRPAMVADAVLVDSIRTDASWRLLDARAVERYRGDVEPIDPVAGHIPGARPAPYADNLTEDGRFASPEALRGRFQPLLGDTPAERVVSYCGSGVTAAHNVLAIALAGFGLARLYPGSWSEWITDPTRPVATGEP